MLELADGTAIAESGAILLYLAEGTDLLPADPVARAHVHQWLFVEQNDVEPNLGRARFWRLTGRDRSRPRSTPTASRAARPRSTASRRTSAAAQWVAGDRYTVADLALWAYVHLAGDADVDLAARPAVQRVDRARAGDAGLRRRPRALSGERAARARVAAGEARARA